MTLKVFVIQHTTFMTKILNVLLGLILTTPVIYLILDFLYFRNFFSCEFPFNEKLLMLSGFLGLVCYVVSVWIIPKIAALTLQANLGGFDLNKSKETRTEMGKVPESLGIVTGTLYITMICILIGFKKNDIMVEFFAGIFSSLFMLFLGFADDVLNLRWRYKIVLPALATLPMLVAYQGVTAVVMPTFIRPYLGTHYIELGLWYYVYMWLVSIYCSNTINIYAGINGLEVTQSTIISIAIICHNLIEMQTESVHNQHLFSLVCMIPFLGSCLGLLHHNWYPSRVFVGDTFTYFSGMTLAVVGILGHFSKTLMLFFIPQWINFFYSLPQLFGIVKCPRHRIPKFNPKTNKLESSGNLTLINLVLEIFGPMHERTLCIILGLIQIFCCGIGFLIRYQLAPYIY